MEQDRVRVALAGADRTTVARRMTDCSLEGLVLEAASGAIADSGLAGDNIDRVVPTTSDQTAGRVIESIVTNGAAVGLSR